MCTVNIAFDKALLNLGIKHFIKCDFDRTPHLCVSGVTGSGKTVLVKLIMAKIGLHIPNAEITLCDFKHDDFRFVEDSDNYYSFIDCAAGLDSFYREFQARQSGEDNNRDFRLLVFDEWASYLNTITDKKTVEAEKLKLATLLMLGRSYRTYVLISQQRLDASYFGAGARDQFGLVIALGNISKEAAQMFGFDRNLMQPVNGVGTGYALTNGTDLRAIQVPLVRDFEHLDSCLKSLI